MGKNLKVKSAAKAFTKERTVYTPQDTTQKTANAKRNTLKHCRKRKTGLLTQDMKNGIILLSLFPI